MSRFKELSQYKMTIMQRILSNQNICKAIQYSESNFLDQPDIADPSILIYNNIYPYKLVTNQIPTTEKTFITLSFRNYKKVNNSFKSGYIYIHVFSHYNLFKTDYGTLRCDYIVSEIDEMFGLSRGLGLGKLEFHDMDELYVNDMYQGLYIAYKVVDFN